MASTTNDIDRVIEAKQSIEKMATELGRMKRAADLLDTAQDQADALLRASDAIINHAGEFAGESTEIIQRLQAIDLESRLGEVSRKTTETQELMSRQLDRLNETLEHLQERNKKVVQTSSALKQQISEVVWKTGEELSVEVKTTEKHLQKELAATKQDMQEAMEDVRKAQSEQNEQIKKSWLPVLILSGINVALLVVVLILMYVR